MLGRSHPRLDAVDWPLRTARLLIRPALLDDGDDVLAYRRLPEVGQWLRRIQRGADEWAREWPARLPTTVVVLRDGRLIGDVRIVVSDGHSQSEVADAAIAQEAELMWTFDPAAHGHGFATEAIGALIDVAFDRLGVRRITACCYAENEPSWRLMERVGMRRESHEVRSARHRDGGWRDFSPMRDSPTGSSGSPRLSPWVSSSALAD